MGWISIYKTMPGVGDYAGIQFNIGTIGDTWHWLHTTGRDLGRLLELDAQYQSNPTYVGGVPGSGLELDELQVRAISTDQNNPSELFGILVLGEEDDPQEAVVVKAYRSSTYTWSVYGTTVDITVQIYKRVYSGGTYTDSLTATCGCRVPLTWVHAHLEFFEYNGDYVAGISDYFYDGSDIKSFYTLWNPTQAAFLQEFHRSPQGKEKSAEFGPASGPDGYGQDGAPGTHDKHSDHVGIPTKPQFGFTSAGFLNHYRISAQGLSMLGEALFPEPAGASGSVEEAVDKLIANAWNSKIIDYVIDCRIIPVTAPATNMENITCGGKVLVHPTSQQPYSAYLVDEDFVDVDCGVISTPLTEGCFLDMITKAKIFIPFYGFVDLAPEYWHGAKIGLYYRFNLMDGSFMAWLTSAPFRSELASASDMEIIGQYAGNACIHLPINSQSYSQIIGGMITTGAAVVGAAAAGAIGGAAARTIAAGAVQTAVSGAANIASGRPQLINNNSYNGSAALMSCRTPYLLIEFAEAQFSRRYVDENGLPAIINRVLGTLSGFTTCVNPIIDFACEQEEAEEIRNLLRSGVIL